MPAQVVEKIIQLEQQRALYLPILTQVCVYPALIS